MTGSITKYWSIFWCVFRATLQSLLAYRFNFFIQSLYGPAYVLVMFLTLLIAYAKAETLAGWTREEGILLFSVFHLLYTFGIITFMRGLRLFLWEGIRRGQLDTLLTKPINPQFGLTFLYPEVQQVLLFLTVFGIFIWQLIPFLPLLNYAAVALFVISLVIGYLLHYFTLTTYCILALWTTQATQILEIYDKVSDFSQYPTPIFPWSIQLLTVSLIPIGFFAYVPTSFLLGRGSFQWLVIGLGLLCVLIPVNRWAWKKGLQHYSSASS